MNMKMQLDNYEIQSEIPNSDPKNPFWITKNRETEVS